MRSATCIEMWGGRWGSNPQPRVWKTRALPIELHPQISERVRPSRFHVLQKFSPAPGSHPRPRKHLTACWTRSVPRAEELDAQCEIRVRALINSMIVKQRPGRTSGAGVHTHARTNPYRGLYLADGTLFWVVFADAERDLRWLGSPFGCPVRLAPSGQRALKAVTDRVRSRVAIIFRDRP